MTSSISSPRKATKFATSQAHFSNPPAKSLINDLPTEIFPLVFANLRNPYLLNFQLSCKKIAYLTRLTIKQISIANFNELHHFSNSNPKRFPNVKTCHLNYRWDIKKSDGHHPHMQATLEHQMLSCKALTDRLVLQVSMFSKLETVTLNCQGLDEAAFRVLLSEAQHLKNLKLVSSSLGNLQLDYSTKLKNLKCLELSDNAHLTDCALVKLLWAAKGLEQLRIEKCCLISCKEIDQLASKILKILKLHVSSSTLDAAAMNKLLHSAPQLEKLDLDTPHFKGLEPIAQKTTGTDRPLLFPKLRDLAMNCRSQSGENLGRLLNEAPQIQRLALKNFQHPAIKFFTPFESIHLKAISLRDCSRLNDSAFMNLTKNSDQLAQLIIDDCEEITDASLRSLKGYALRKINLNMMGCEISDLALKELMFKAPLIHLRLSDCLSLSDKAFIDLHLPYLQTLALEDMSNLFDMVYFCLIGSNRVLNKLSLCRTKITYSTLIKLITKMPRLVHVILNETSITHRESVSLKNWLEIERIDDEFIRPCSIEFKA